MQDADWTLPVLKQHLETRLAASETARLMALEALDRRFARIETANERAASMMSRVEVEAALNGLAKRSEAEVKAVAIKLDTFGRTNWPLLLSLGSLVAVVVSGTWAVVSLKIENGLTPLRLEISELQSELKYAGHKPAP